MKLAITKTRVALKAISVTWRHWPIETAVILSLSLTQSLYDINAAYQARKCDAMFLE